MSVLYIIVQYNFNRTQWWYMHICPFPNPFAPFFLHRLHPTRPPSCPPPTVPILPTHQFFFAKALHSARSLSTRSSTARDWPIGLLDWSLLRFDRHCCCCFCYCYHHPLLQPRRPSRYPHHPRHHCPRRFSPHRRLRTCRPLRSCRLFSETFRRKLNENRKWWWYLQIKFGMKIQIEIEIQFELKKHNMFFERLMWWLRFRFSN